MVHRGASKALRLAGLGRGRLLLVAALLALAGLMACTQGSYPVDFFYEMHYQVSYGANEPPRLSPPEEAVPWFGPPAPTKSGAELFAINCSMCHGLEGKGDGRVLRIMEAKFGYTPAVPPDLSSPLVQGYDDDNIFHIISTGTLPPELGGIVLPVMPAFEKLLSPQERRLIVEHVLTLGSE